MGRLKVLLHLCAAACAVVFCTPCGLIGLIVVNPIVAQGLAGRMVPPRYPGNRLVDTRSSCGSSAGGQGYFYSTRDTTD